MTEPRDLDGWQAWRQARHDELAGADSWLGLAGLYWLEPGGNPVGAAAGVLLPGAPPLLGEIRLADGRLQWLSAASDELRVDELAVVMPGGVAGNFLQVELQSDAAGSPTVLGWRDLRFHVIERDGRFAVRVRNRGWARERVFAGLAVFPFAAEWQIEAQWQALTAPRTMEVPAVSGELKLVSVTHRAVFEHAGATVELLPLSVAEEAVFFVFRDATSGRSTYGGGRFLRAAPPQRGLIGLDFNRCYNPPCVFSPFATCPLPPPENWLGFPVEAGEKRYLGAVQH
jgi:hypothetical protein